MDTRKVYEGKHVVLFSRGNWEFVERKTAKEAVVILAVTEDDRIVLVEQFRQPVQARVIELPAGLIENAGPEETAKRELEEETGYACDEVELLTSGPTSPGITTEIAHLYRAKNVRSRGKGGGVNGEEITVHAVPRREIEAWLRRKAKEGVLVDFKLWGGLYFASQST
jgi:ADP-ribose pyrophosphatase